MEFDEIVKNIIGKSGLSEEEVGKRILEKQKNYPT